MHLLIYGRSLHAHHQRGWHATYIMHLRHLQDGLANPARHSQPQPLYRYIQHGQQRLHITITYYPFSLDALACWCGFQDKEQQDGDGV